MAAKPASFMSSIMRARNGDIVCSFVIEDGTIPCGGFYTGPNVNVGQINPPSFYQGQELAERPR